MKSSSFDPTDKKNDWPMTLYELFFKLISGFM